MTELETNVEKGLRTMDVPGYIWFGVKAEDTPENQAVHDAFRAFCKAETGNNYTLGLRKLLEYIEDDWKYESLYDHIEQLQVRVAKIEKPVKEKKKEDTETF